jgi:hypothetical protein
MKYNDISVHILVNGVALPEYQENFDENEKELTCYIPSETGQNYSIEIICGNETDYGKRIRELQNKEGLSFGQKIDGYRFAKYRYERYGHYIINCNPTEQTVKFVDLDVASKLESINKEIGTIKVKCSRTKKLYTHNKIVNPIETNDAIIDKEQIQTLTSHATEFSKGKVMHQKLIKVHIM